ncbi:macro domain-containing protein CT2219-like [Babylonia areolata]|uniref:macro domain-containing protein CT2219-like n=1 Tax=Babylonia areolata TaxID=304850 RepID=UPI003FD60625
MGNCVPRTRASSYSLRHISSVLDEPAASGSDANVVNINAERERSVSLSVSQRRKLYRCKLKDVLTLEDIKAWGATGETTPPIDGLDDYDRFGCPIQYNAEFNRTISLVQADITVMEVDAIVNPTKNSEMRGGAVARGVHRAAGPSLAQECGTLTGCYPGSVQVTAGYRLPAKYVIHAVGIIGGAPTKQASCYYGSLEYVKLHKLKSVAFPCITSGYKDYSVEEMCDMSVQGIQLWMDMNPSYVAEMDRIILCASTDEDMSRYARLLKLYFPLPSSTPCSEDNAAAKISIVSTEVQADFQGNSLNLGGQIGESGQAGQVILY